MRRGLLVLLVAVAGCAAARIRPDGTMEAFAIGQAHASTSTSGAFPKLDVSGGALSSPAESAIAAVVAAVVSLAQFGVF